MEVLEEQLHSDTDQTLELMANMVHATDPVLRAKAKRLAASLIVHISRESRVGTSGGSRLAPSRAEHDIDVDSSLEAIIGARAEGVAPNLEDLFARSWTRPPLAIALVIDASGSMKGSRLAAASMLAAAVSLKAPSEHAIISFAKTPHVIREITSPMQPEEAVDRVLSLRGHGVTGLRGALDAAREQLARSKAGRKVVLLMSDCRATDDEDPLPAALALPILRIVAPFEDSDEAAAFAAKTNARWAAPETIAQLPSVVRQLMNQ